MIREMTGVPSFHHTTVDPYAVTVLRDGEVASSRVVDAPPDTFFQAGSISKSVTALVVLELARRSMLVLDGDVNDQLRHWQLPDAAGISVRDLLGHTGGVGIGFYPGYSQHETAPTLLEELDGRGRANTPPVRVDRRFRGRFHYSGGGYAILQQLVCDITGESFDDAAREAVLAPLDMSSTSFTRHPPGRSANPAWHSYPACAAAGMWTTANDLARFLLAVQGALPDGSGRQQAVDRMLAPQAHLPFNGDWRLLPLFGLRPPDFHGLGLFLHGDHHFSHFGGAAGFFSAIVGSRRDGSGAAVMTTGSPLQLFAELRRIGREQGWQDFFQPVWKRWTGILGLRYLA